VKLPVFGDEKKNTLEQWETWHKLNNNEFQIIQGGRNFIQNNLAPISMSFYSKNKKVYFR
jgi:hypothetical protein